MRHPGLRVIMAPLVVGLLASAACSTPTSDSQKSDLWDSAQTSFAEGDFEDTLKKLDSVIQAEPARRQDAAAWRIVVLTALAKGYSEIAKAYDEGGAHHHNRIAAFRRAKNAYESKSRGPTLALADMARDLPSLLEGADTIALDFPFPAGSSSPSSLIAFIRQGRKLKDADADKALDYTLRRSAMLTMAELAGHSRDPESARELFERGPVHLPRSAFLAFVGRALYEQADLFAKTRINDLDKREVMLRTSEELLDYTRVAQAQQARMLDLWKDELTRRADLDRRRAR